MAASGLESKGEEGNFSHIIVYGKLHMHPGGSVRRGGLQIAHLHTRAAVFHITLLLVSAGRGDLGCNKCERVGGHEPA